jgi:hypothetical protein
MSTNGAAPDTDADPFDPANLQLSQDFIGEAGVKKPLTTVPVKKPNKHDFIRVHPDPAYRMQTAMVEYGEDKEHFLFTPSMAALLPNECSPYRIYTAIGRRGGGVFLWPVRLPGSDGKDNEWWRSAHEHAAVAQTVWARITSNKALGAYERQEATTHVIEPVWPRLPLKELLRIAFREKLVDRPDHEVVKALRGEA